MSFPPTSETFALPLQYLFCSVFDLNLSVFSLHENNVLKVNLYACYCTIPIHAF